MTESGLKVEFSEHDASLLSSKIPESKKSWTLIDKIRFVVLYRVRWGTTLVALFSFIVVYCLQHYKVWPPSLNMPVVPQNPWIQYPNRPDIIPIWAIYVVLAACPFVFLVGEYFCYRPDTSSWELSLGASAWLSIGRRTTIWVLAMIESFSWTSLVCFVLKQVVGELRPNYLNALSSTNLTGGRNSFPSGHTSFSFSVCTMYTLYLYWAIFYRLPPHENDCHETDLRFSIKRAVKAEFILICKSVLPFSFMAFAIGVSVSRVIDFHHYIWDITYGMILGMLFAILVLLRTIVAYFQPISVCMRRTPITSSV